MTFHFLIFPGHISQKVRKYKNDSTESKNKLVSKLPCFSLACTVREKNAAISKQSEFWVPSSRSFLSLLKQKVQNRFTTCQFEAV